MNIIFRPIVATDSEALHHLSNATPDTGRIQISPDYQWLVYRGDDPNIIVRQKCENQEIVHLSIEWERSLFKPSIDSLIAIHQQSIYPKKNTRPQTAPPPRFIGVHQTRCEKPPKKSSVLILRPIDDVVFFFQILPLLITNDTILLSSLIHSVITMVSIVITFNQYRKQL